jgi:hypothetical protein
MAISTCQRNTLAKQLEGVSTLRIFLVAQSGKVVDVKYTIKQLPELCHYGIQFYGT